MSVILLRLGTGLLVGRDGERDVMVFGEMWNDSAGDS